MIALHTIFINRGVHEITEKSLLAKAKQAPSVPASGSVTLRFDGGLLEDLRRESEHKRISLNTLATQIFRTHAEYGSMSAKAGMVSFHKSLLIRIMDRLSEEEILKLSEYIAKNEMKDTVLLMKKKYTVDAFVDFIESWARVSGFEYRHDISGDTHSFVIQHDMGARWSIYINNVFKHVFSDIGAKWADFHSNDNTVTFNVEI
jgi:hypothetical protein